jgi:MarR family transcriptional regulator for hemolysin
MKYTRPPTPEFEHLFLVHEVAHLMRTLADQRARARGMTRAQWMILRKLERTPGLSQNELASIVEVEPITVGRLVDRLEARGLVERRDDPHDRRIHRLHLTAGATPSLVEIGDNIADLSAAMLAGIDKSTLDMLAAGLRAMKANLSVADRPLQKSEG